MINNPYNGILSIIKQQNNTSSPAVVIGKVISNNPLSVSIGELFLDREDLMVNENIKGFNQGDTLAMVPTSNKQKYIILCKVVNL
nr:DUF2577 family protein [uncultured Cellulosilyticum sp.]